MNKAKLVVFRTSNLKGHGFHGNKAAIFYLTSEYYLESTNTENLDTILFFLSSLGNFLSVVQRFMIFDTESKH